MFTSKKYRAQHEAILALADEIYECLNAHDLAEDASHVRVLLSKFLGKVKINLAVEDQSLYPILLDQNDVKLRKMVREYIDEMGGLAEAVDEYSIAWPSTEVIQRHSKMFVAQTNDLLNALVRRFNKEDHELFMVSDELGIVPRLMP